MGTRLWVAATGAVLACGSADPALQAERCPGREQAAVIRCRDASLSPVTDPESPEFGRVPCRFFAFDAPGSDFCECSVPGFRPLGAADEATARGYFESVGACTDACCEDMCFCELLQLSGDELAVCQAGDPASTLDLPGFCYVEPELGIGDPSTTSDCKPYEQYQLLFTPNHATYQGLILCEKSPG